MNVPTFTFGGVSTAVTYRFNVGPDNIGWAFCTINDSIGELNVQSDWGSWAYRWSPNPKHLGAPTLTDSIATSWGPHSIADKLWCAAGGSSYGGQVFSAEATVKAMRKALAERRLEQGREHLRAPHGITWKRHPWWPVGEGQPLTKQVARELWDALNDLDDLNISEDLFSERFYQIDDHQWIAEESVTEYLETEQSGKYRVLCEGIIPALIAACRERLATSTKVVAAAETHADA